MKDQTQIVIDNKDLNWGLWPVYMNGF